MSRIRTVFARIEAHWLGDLLGCACLFGSLYLAMVMAGVLL